VEEAVDVLREEIVTGRLAAGAQLRLEPLAERLGMSMMPVREALRSLEALGLVEQRPRRGARVSPFSVEDLFDTYEARLALEVMAVRRAAERFTAEDEAAARRHLDAHILAIANGDTTESRQAHTSLHFTIYEAAGSGWLVRLITPLWVSSERYRIISLPLRGSVDDRMREHKRIIDGCARHNPRVAARELYEHLARTANLVARHFGEQELF
jgi:DNA-binding GntR family transcriptional regulator